MNISTLYSKIITTGINTSKSEITNKRIKILNTYALVWINLIVILTLIEKLLQFIIITTQGGFNDTYEEAVESHFSHGQIVQLLTATFLLVVILLNKYNKFNAARVLFLLVSLANFTAFTLHVTPGIYTEYFYLIVPPLALSLYSKNTIPFIVLIISFLLYVTPYRFYPVYPENIIERFYPIPQVYIFISIYLLVNYFKKINSKNEKLLQFEKDKVLNDKTILENQQLELKKLNKFKSHFFINISHEIRTPLTLIQGHASQINLNDSNEKTQEKIDVVKEQSQQIYSIVNNIMDLGKIDSKEFQINTEFIELNNFLNKHYNQFKNLFIQKSISFSLENKTENLLFKIDDYMFSKSISNLLSNALKFTSKGGYVVLKACVENKKLKIELTDNGIGIPKEDINNVFNRFFQSKNDITKSEGSGIGLTFTKSIVEAHNFSIDVKSTPNQATTFSIEIPSDAFTKTQTIITTPNFETKSDIIEKTIKQTHSKRQVLIVEDHKQMRIFLAGLLDNYIITEAKNGEEALNILKTNNFDAIITDYMMPVMDGETLVQNIKKQNIKTPIIVLTARTDAKGKLNMLRLGIDGYLNKPFIKEELFLHLKQAFQSIDNINKFDKKLKLEERQSLNKFAIKFNKELNEFIFNNMHTSTFGIDAIAEHFNISKSTLNRKTKTLLGQVPKDIVMEARLQKARVLIEENPTETQKNIANAVGISNTTYFFKKIEERFHKKQIIK